MSVQTVNGAAVVDRRSPVPLYFQLARLLAGEIESLGWPAGHRLSSEAEICQRYGVSRATVRQALQRLENEGLIERFKGAGTFVADTRGRSWLLQSPAGFFHDEVGRAGVEVTSKILRAQVTGLPRWAAAALGLDDGAEGVVLERLRYADGRVALHVTDYLPAVHAAAALSLEHHEGSLYDRLEPAGISVFGGRRTLEATRGDPRIAKLLEVGPRAPLLFIESVSWDAQMHPFHCYQLWLRTDRVSIEVEVTRSTTPVAAAEVGRLST